jgi:hypothetical protein
VEDRFHSPLVLFWIDLEHLFGASAFWMMIASRLVMFLSQLVVPLQMRWPEGIVHQFDYEAKDYRRPLAHTVNEALGLQQGLLNASEPHCPTRSTHQSVADTPSIHQNRIMKQMQDDQTLHILPHEEILLQARLTS